MESQTPALSPVLLPPLVPYSAASVETKAPLTLLAQLATELAKNKPGWQTTEFALVTLAIGALIVFSALGKIPPAYGETVAGVVALGFGWLRNNRKDSREDSLLALVETISQAAPLLPHTHTTTPGPKVADESSPMPATSGAEPVAPSGGSVSGGAQGGYVVHETLFLLVVVAAVVAVVWLFSGFDRSGASSSAIRNPQFSTFTFQSPTSPAFPLVLLNPQPEPIERDASEDDEEILESPSPEFPVIVINRPPHFRETLPTLRPEHD